MTNKTRNKPEVNTEEETLLREFLAVGNDRSNTFKVSDQKKMPKQILKDLVSSPRKVSLIYLGLSFLGYLLSLAICAQNGVGVLPFSYWAASRMHIIPWPYCPIVCGSIFSLVPNIFTRFFLTSFQQRFLYKHLTWLVVIVPMSASLTLALFGNRDPLLFLNGFFGGGFSAAGWLLMWTLGAVSVPFILEFIFVAWLFRGSKRAVKN